MEGEGEKVAVFVRSRPLLGKELEHDDVGCLSFGREQKSLEVDGRRKKQFTFDRVFHPEEDQTAVYAEVTDGLLESIFSGVNVTLMSYGQTGSGKTYTMGTSENVDAKHRGVVPRFLNDLFEMKEKSFDSKYEIKFRAQLIEIYNSQIIDLLRMEGGATSSKGKIRVLRGDVTGVESQPISCFQDAMSTLVRGLVNRKVESNNVNEDSSRSHAIFTVLMEACARDDAELVADQPDTFTSKITFVDLAGSERLSKTKSEGDRRKEGININKGLLELGRVINVLADPQNHNMPPYRNSTLTMVLQDALGGNSRTVFIACISPAKEHSSETESTLGYANNVKRISNKVVVNITQSTRQIMELRKQRDAALRAYAKVRFGYENHDDSEVDKLMSESKVMAAIEEVMKNASVETVASVPAVRRQAWPAETKTSTTSSFTNYSKQHNPDQIVCAAARKKDSTSRRASVGAFGEQIDLEMDEEANAEQIAFLDNEISELQEQSANIESNEEDIEIMNKDIADKVKMLEALKHTIEEEMPKLKSHIEELTEQQNLQEIEREKLLSEIAKKEQEMAKDLKGKTSEQAKARLKALRDRLREKEKEISSIAGKLSHSRRSVQRMKRQQSERERLENDLHRLKQKRATMVREIREMKKEYEKRQKQMTLKMNKMSKTLNKQKRKMDTMARKQEQIIQTKDRLQQKLMKKNKQLKSREDAIKKLCQRRVAMRKKRYRSDTARKSGEHKYEAASEEYTRKYEKMCSLQERLREVQEELERLHQTCPSSAEETEENDEDKMEIEENKDDGDDENKVEELEEEANWLVVEIENLKGKMEKELEESVNKMQLKEARKLLIKTIRDRAGIEMSSEMASRQNAKRFATVKKQRDEERKRARETEALNRTLQKKLKMKRKLSMNNDNTNENEFESPTKRRRTRSNSGENKKKVADTGNTPFMEKKRWAHSLRDNTSTENVRRNGKQGSQMAQTVKKAPRLDQIRFENAMKRQKQEQRKIQESETEKQRAKRRQTMGMASIRAKSRDAQKRDGDNFLSHAKATVRKSRKRQSLLPSTLKQPLRQRRRQSTGAIPSGSLLISETTTTTTALPTKALGPPRRK